MYPLRSQLFYLPAVSIEPDLENYKEMIQRKQRLCAEWNINETAITIINADVGDKTEAHKFIK